MRDKSEHGDLNEPAIVDREPRRGMLNPDLSWTHYRLLTKVESSQAADFYKIEAVRNHWSSRELECSGGTETGT